MTSWPRWLSCSAVVSFLVGPLPQVLLGQGTTDLTRVSLSDLLNVRVVTASKQTEPMSRAPSTMSVITSEEIRTSGAESVLDLVSRQPSVFLFGTAGSITGQLSIRGDYSELGNIHILFLVDGRPFRDNFGPQNTYEILLAFPLDVIEQIEIIRGPGSVLYGAGAYAGVINIVTKRPDRQPVTIRAESGSWGSRQAAAAGSVSIGDIHASGGVVYSHSGGWDFAAADELGVTRSVPMASTNAGGFLQLDYGALRSTTYVGSVVRRVMAFTRTVWDSPPEIEQRGLHLVTDLEYRFEPAPAWASAINLTFNYLYGHPGYDADSARDDVFRSTSYTTLLEWTNRLRVSETTGLLAGASMENDQGDAVQPTLTLVSGIPRPFNVFHGTNPDPLELYPDVNATHWSAFLQFEHAPFIWLSIVAGLQANKVAGADVTVVPRLSFISTWESHWNAKLMYGKAFRSPIVAERYVLVPNVLYGNDGLGPELVETVEAVFMYRGRSSEAGVTAFRSRQSDVIRSTFRGEQLPNTLNGVQTPLGVPFFVNRGTVSIQGIELEGKASVTQDLDFTGSLTYQTEEGTFPLRPGVDTTAGNTNGMPRLLLKVGCEYRGLEGCTFGLFDAFAGSTPDLPAQNFYNAPVRDVHIVSANIRFDLKEIFSLSGPSVMFNVRISNLLDEESSFANPSQRVVNTLPLYPGRQYSAGLRVTL